MKSKKIDLFITSVPFLLISALAILFFVVPEGSNKAVLSVRNFLGNQLGSYYLAIGLGIFLISIFLAFSKFGRVKLGEKDEKPKYNLFSWGSMMFTAGLAADILFYSFSEWILYAQNTHIQELGGTEKWANVFPIFHWSFIPWSFYLVLAVCFGYMLHVKKTRRQKFSEACRPILKEKTDGFFGRIIDLIAVFALVAGTATTFSLATPLMSKIINDLFGVNFNETLMTIIIILITCVIYTYSLLHGFKGISALANLCVYLFGLILMIFLIFGGYFKEILGYSVTSFWRMLSHFFELATFTDPKHTSNFPQDWTIFYWAYWLVWSVATPFFIGNISKGRTVKQVILGGYFCGVGSTIISFMILGNYSFAQQISGSVDFLTIYSQSGNLYEIVMLIIKSMPMPQLILSLVLITMVCFYATSFDSIAFIAACYSYKELKENESPHRMVQLMWCILLIVLPIALIFSESSMANLQSVSIIAAFPLGICVILIIASFFVDVNQKR